MTSMFPDHPDTPPRPFALDPAAIRQAMAHPKTDNSAYLAAVKEFRERYEQAERAMGAIEICELTFRKIP